MTQHGIIGCGRVAPNHVDGFRATGRQEVSWACDRDERKAADFAGAHGIARSTPRLTEVLDDPDVVSVSVAIDHAQHAAVVEQALLAGKHVLCEKPLALVTTDGERLLALAGQRDLVLSVVSQHRYDPLVLAVRNWLRDGLLGDVLFAQVSLEAQREPEYYSESYWRGSWSGEGGSALINQGYHCLDVTRFLLGHLRVEAAVARTAVLSSVMETEDTLSALLVADVIPVTLNVTVCSATTWRSRLEIVGTQGAVTFDIDHPAFLHRVSGNPELVRRAESVRDLINEPLPPGIDYYGVSHRHQIAAFVRAVLDGGPREDPDAGLGMVSLLDELYVATRFGGRRQQRLGTASPSQELVQ
jgi:predicted dehydrogenase